MSARLTDEQRQLRSILEEPWRKVVEEEAKRAGWWTYHPPRAGVRRGKAWTASAAGTSPGWPDETMLRDGVMLAVELKTETGKVTEAQQQVLDRLRLVPGVYVDVWRPRDLARLRVILRDGPTWTP